MAVLLRGMELTVRWRETLGARLARDAALDAVLSWIRTIALEDDIICIDAPPVPLARLVGRRLGQRCAYVRFGVPSLPTARPQLVEEPGARSRARFVIRSRTNAGGEPTNSSASLLAAGGEPGWRRILNM